MYLPSSQVVLMLLCQTPHFKKHSASYGWCGSAGAWPVGQKVTGSIPGQDTYPGCGFALWLSTYKKVAN